MKHYGRYLPDAGKQVYYKCEDIERLYIRKQDLEKKLNSIINEIENLEKDFLEFASTDWTLQEIEEAKILQKEKNI